MKTQNIPTNSGKRFAGCKTMENQLFDWKIWDQADIGDFFFYDCILKVDIGGFKKGEHIDSILWCNSKSVMEFYEHGEMKQESGYSVRDQKVIGTFELKVSVGSEIGK